MPQPDEQWFSPRSRNPIDVILVWGVVIAAIIAVMSFILT